MDKREILQTFLVSILRLIYRMNELAKEGQQNSEGFRILASAAEYLVYEAKKYE